MSQFLNQDKLSMTRYKYLSDCNVFRKIQSWGLRLVYSLIRVTRDLVSGIEAYPSLSNRVQHSFWTDMITYLPW